MAVALRGYTQMTAQKDGDATLVLPGGTAAKDLAIVVCQDGRDGDNHPEPQTGWTHVRDGIWYKRLTAADISAGSVELHGRTTSLQTFSGAARIARAVTQKGRAGVNLGTAGSGLFVNGWGARYESTIDPSSGRLGAVVQDVNDKRPNSNWFVAHTTTGYKSLSGVDSDAYYVACDIEPEAGPDAPSLVTPVAGAHVDVAADTPFTWTHNSTSGLPQTHYLFRVRKVGAGSWSYVTSGGTITGTETPVTSGTSAASIDAGQLDALDAYEWTILTSEDGVVYSAAAASQEFLPVAQPTVDNIVVTSPAEDLTPLVQVVWTLGYGAASAWQVRITESGAADSEDGLVYDTGVLVVGSNQGVIIPPVDTDGNLLWGNGSTYTAWVRVWQDGGLVSDWTEDDANFTISWTALGAPNAPTAANQTDGPLQVTITGISASADGLEVQWSPDGSTWSALTTVDDPSTTEVVDVPLAPYGVAYRYRARQFDTIDAVDLPSAWATIASPVASTDTGEYLASDEDQTDYLPVLIVEDTRRAVVQGRTVSYGLGSTTPRVDRGPVAGQAGTTILRTDTVADRDALTDWITDRDVFWIRWAPEGSTIHATPSDAGTLRVTARNAPQLERVAQIPIHRRLTALDWVEVPG